MSRPTPKALADLLASAVHEPGVISRAYSAFHGYSISNRLLAMAQCVEREVQPGPINTFPGWKALGRHVRKGEKAITLCMPITVRRKQADVEPDADETADIITRFVYKPRWFVVSQTSGDPIPEAVEPSWDRETALSGLDVTEIPFDHTDGNCMGFARDRSIAINPINPLPHKTRFHEIAHVLLGHTSAGCRPTRRSARARSRSAKRSPSRCSAVRPWSCPASPRLAATSRPGGRARSPSGRRSGSSRRPIRSSRREQIRGCGHDDPSTHRSTGAFDPLPGPARTPARAETR